MLRNLDPFFSALLSVVLGTLLLVMSAAFITIPQDLGRHPGEKVITANATVDYHPT